MAKILLVEDDINLGEIYQARMEAEGYEVVAASDGETALALAAKEKPDLIISDVMMPKISGFEMLDILRNTDGLKQTRVIMLTALGQAEDRARADSMGADRYLVKSQVTLEDIVTAAKELLGEAPVVDNTEQVSAPASIVSAEPVAVVPAPVQEAPTEPLSASEPAAMPQPAVAPAETDVQPAAAQPEEVQGTDASFTDQPANPADTPVEEPIITAEDQAVEQAVNEQLSTQPDPSQPEPAPAEHMPVEPIPAPAQPEASVPQTNDTPTAEPIGDDEDTIQYSEEPVSQSYAQAPVEAAAPDNAAQPTEADAHVATFPGDTQALAPEPDTQAPAPEPTPALYPADAATGQTPETAAASPEQPAEPAQAAYAPHAAAAPEAETPSQPTAPAAPAPQDQQPAPETPVADITPSTDPALQGPPSEQPKTDAEIDNQVVSDAVDKLLAKVDSNADYTPVTEDSHVRQRIISPIEHPPQPTLDELLAQEEAKEAAQPPAPAEPATAESAPPAPAVADSELDSNDPDVAELRRAQAEAAARQNGGTQGTGGGQPFDPNKIAL